jgi:hypothetical protein
VNKKQVVVFRPPNLKNPKRKHLPRAHSRRVKWQMGQSKLSFREPGIMNVVKTYRVIGVRSGGASVVVDEGLTVERANHVWTLLACANAFPRVRIEIDQPLPNGVSPAGFPWESTPLAGGPMAG